MKTRKTRFCGIMLCLIVALCTSVGTVSVFAAETSTSYVTEQALLTKTNTYVCTEYDSENYIVKYDLARKNAARISDLAQITVFTHGWGGNAGHWSNQYSKNNPDATFAYDEDSLPFRIKEMFGANVYWAKMNAGSATEYTLYDITDLKNQKYDVDDIDMEYAVVDSVDASKHAVIVFEANNSRQRDENGGNDYIYFQFNNMLSKVINSVAERQNGILPKVNLIGHSRGGITNMQYALDHPDLVSSLISLGTPYFGSTTAQLWASFAGEDAELRDILDETKYGEYARRWNARYETHYKNINALAIGSYATVEFICGCLLSDISGFIKPNMKLLVPPVATLVPVLSGFGSLYNMVSGFFGSSLADLLEGFFDDRANAEALASIIANEITLSCAAGTLIWNNDVCVPLDSQLGKSDVTPSGGSTYKGFKRMTKTFRSSGTYNLLKVSANMPPVPHNLEARDGQIMSWVLSELTTEENEFTYSYSNGEATVTGIMGHMETPIAEIPAEHDGYTVTAIADNAFNQVLEGLHTAEVIIPDSVETIGNYAFADNPCLQKVTFGNNSRLKSIGVTAFGGDVGLTEIVLPRSLSHIGNVAFYGCESLEAFKVESDNADFTAIDGVIYHGDNLFAYPAGKKDEDYTVSGTLINEYAFAENKCLKTVHAAKVKRIGEYAFYNTQIELRGRQFGIGAFAQDNFVLEYVGKNALSDTTWQSYLAESCSTIGKIFYRYKGSLFDDTLRKEVSIVLSDYTQVCFGAFLGESKLSAVTLGGDLKLIDDYAFYACSGLQDVYISNCDAIINIGEGVFDKTDCKIYVPQALKEQYLADPIWQQYADRIDVLRVPTAYYLNGGNFAENAETNIYFGEEFELPIPTKEYYNFDGWYGNAGFDGERYSYIDARNPQVVIGVKFYAKWTPIEYNLILDANGGSVDEKSNISMSYTVQGSDLPTPIFTGHNFDGWYKSQNFTDSDYIRYGIPSGYHGDLTLYAKYEYKMREYSGKSGTITDSDSESYYLTVSTGYDNDRVAGTTVKTIRVSLTLTLWEEDDGYQHIDFYGYDINRKQTLSLTNKLSHGTGVRACTTPQTYTFTYDLNISDYPTTTEIEVVLSASGAFSDTWHYKDLTVGTYLIA